MKVYQASEAKAKLLQILDDVERGETVQITRHGKPIARLVPEDSPDERQRQIAEAKAAIAAIREARKQMPRVTLDEILEWRDEGRK